MSKKNPLRRVLIGVNIVSAAVALLLTCLLIMNTLNIALFTAKDKLDAPVSSNSSKETENKATVEEETKAAAGETKAAAIPDTPARVVIDNDIVVQFGSDEMFVKDGYIYEDDTRTSLIDDTTQITYSSKWWGDENGYVGDPKNKRNSMMYTRKKIEVMNGYIYTLLESITGQEMLLLKVPTSGGKAEFIMGVPPGFKMFMYNNQIYFINNKNLIVYDDNSRTIKTQEVELSIYYYSKITVVKDHLYYISEDLSYNYSLCRYSLTTGENEQVVSGYGELFRDNELFDGTLVGGVYYGKSEDPNGIQFLLAYDISTGKTKILDAIMDDTDLMKIDNSYVFHSNGGIFYSSDNKGGYSRYDTTSGEISHAYTLESGEAYVEIFDPYCLMWTRDSKGRFENDYLVDPDTGKIASPYKTKKYEDLPNLDTSELTDQAIDITQNIEENSVYVYGGESYPLQ